MIKYISVLTCFTLCSLSLPVSAAKQDYKCYVNTTKGSKVLFYRWQEKDAQLRSARIVGKQLTDNKGKKYFIKEVEECVLLSQDFKSEKAKEQDKQTLR
ncbi:TapY2 family type IVa secretion system protein [Shewanella subflava]|uniref:TapY2 family type IVa secretion system protein n=1 Tax=Shewanella subflava TaxID=2986476 RepID=A0ABT3IBJ7_9GAMM|nr:TapY2 family type IVa secretion system protein [Shewanella subflava]MCW3173434.1 TapY2 family type IVa secretion system protein [Shewanella subflava]